MLDVIRGCRPNNKPVTVADAPRLPSATAPVLKPVDETATSCAISSEVSDSATSDHLKSNTGNGQGESESSSILKACHRATTPP